MRVKGRGRKEEDWRGGETGFRGRISDIAVCVIWDESRRPPRLTLALFFFLSTYFYSFPFLSSPRQLQDRISSLRDKSEAGRPTLCLDP
jgi:hypothetical protein